MQIPNFPSYLIVVFCALLLLTLYIMIDYFSDRGLKRRKKFSKKSEGLTNRLSAVLEEENINVEHQEEFYKKLGSESPMSLKMKKIVLNSTTGDNAIMAVTILIFGLAAGIAIATIFLPAYKIGAIGIGLTVVFVALGILNMIKTQSMYNKTSATVRLLTALQIQYQNSSTVLDAAMNALNTISRVSLEYKILNSFIERVKDLHIPVTTALDILQKELGDLVQIKQYITITKKAETISSEYKRALDGIPENLSGTLADMKDYTLSTIISTIYLTVVEVVWLFILAGYLVSNVGKKIEGIEYLNLSIMLMLIITAMSVVLLRVKKSRKWGK